MKIEANIKDWNEQVFAWNTVKAITLALGFITSIKVFYRAQIISLIDFGFLSPFIEKGSMLFVLFLGASLVFRPAKRSYFLILFFTNLLCWIYNYSSGTAFQSHVGLLCLFVYFADPLSDKEKKIAGSLFVSAIFLTATSFKLNLNYFSGAEFLPGGSFFFYVYRYFSFGEWLQKSGLIQILPWISILAEAGLGIFILFRPQKGVQLVILFILLLALVHPPVIFVYFSFLPFAFLFNSKFIRILKNQSQSYLLATPFIWFFFMIVIRRSYSMIHYPNYAWELIVLVAVLFCLHIYWIMNNDSEKERLLPEAIHNLKLFAMPAVVITAAVLRHIGAPAPMGYSMFSGTLDKTRVHMLSISNDQVCATMLDRFDITLVGEARFISPEKDVCFITFPTRSGIETVKKALCSRDPAIEWYYKERGGNSWVKESCRESNFVVKRARLGQLTPEEVDRIFREKVDYIQSLYKVRHDPYFGQPDKDESCLKDLDLKGAEIAQKDIRALTFKLKANENLIYGTCDSEQEIYNSELTFIYCKGTQALTEIKVFWPLNSDKGWKLDLEQECKRAVD